MRLRNAIMASLAGKRKKPIHTQRREQEVTPVRKDNTPPSLSHTFLNHLLPYEQNCLLAEYKTTVRNWISWKQTGESAPYFYLNNCSLPHINLCFSYFFSSQLFSALSITFLDCLNHCSPDCPSPWSLITAISVALCWLSGLSSYIYPNLTYKNWGETGYSTSKPFLAHRYQFPYSYIFPVTKRQNSFWVTEVCVCTYVWAQGNCASVLASNRAWRIQSHSSLCCSAPSSLSGSAKLEANLLRIQEGSEGKNMSQNHNGSFIIFYSGVLNAEGPEMNKGMDSG